MINSFLPIIAILGVAAASGLVGVFALTRRMTLAADALSHVALPGLGVAILLKINPIIGGAAALILGVFLVWWVERRTHITTETVIGVVFSASLAIGSLLIESDEELLDALFGDLGSISLREGLIGIVVALTIIALLISFKEKFTLAFISSDLAKTMGLNVAKLDLIFLLMFSVTVILGVKFLGALLMGALIIIPAATSRNLARSLNSDLLISLSLSILAVVIGIIASNFYGSNLGPTIITAASILFFLSLFLRKES